MKFKLAVNNREEEETDELGVYWCKGCSRLLTRAQAMTLSCSYEIEEVEIMNLNFRNNIDSQRPIFFKADGRPYRYHALQFHSEHPTLTTISDPIPMSSFVKYIREKHRLCWKEIYLKLAAITMDCLDCTSCHTSFQLSEMASCKIGLTPEMWHLYS